MFLKALLNDYSLYKSDITVGDLTPLAGSNPDTTPRNQVYVRSQLDLLDNIEFDMLLRWIDSIGELGVESYVELDARLGYLVSDSLELALVANNLLDDGHAEFAPSFVGAETIENQRAFFAKATWTLD